MSRRTIALILSVVLAAVATIAILSYVQGLEKDALGDAEPTQVFVASDLIPAGTSGDSAIQQGLIEQKTVPAAVRPDGAIATLEEIRGRVADVTIFAQETIIAARFVEPGRAGSGLAIPKNKVAMSIEVGIPAGVSGFVRAGDRIGVVAHFNFVDTQNRQIDVSQFVVQDIEVLAVGRRVVIVTEQGEEQATQASEDRVLMTVAVSAQQAERLVFSINEGAIYFTLLPEGFKPTDTSGRNANNVLPR